MGTKLKPDEMPENGPNAYIIGIARRDQYEADVAAIETKITKYTKGGDWRNSMYEGGLNIALRAINAAWRAEHGGDDHRKPVVFKCRPNDGLPHDVNWNGGDDS